MRHHALAVLLLAACTDESAPETDRFGPIVQAVEAAGGEAFCAGGSAPFWEVCLVQANDELTVVVPDTDGTPIADGLWLVLSLEGQNPEIEIDLASPTDFSIPWEGGTAQGRIVRERGGEQEPVGSFRGELGRSD